MLRDGPYPWSVKQRVLSRVGHLSNHAAADFLQNDYDGAATCIVLGHLSESNNVPELARLAAEQAVAGRPALLGNRILLPASPPRSTPSPSSVWQVKETLSSSRQERAHSCPPSQHGSSFHVSS